MPSAKRVGHLQEAILSVHPSGTNLYKEAGVDVEKGDALVDWLQASDKSAAPNPYGNVVSGIGGFAALYRPNFKGMQDPLLVTSTDGVGTKVLLGLEQNALEGLGIDLVAMCVNDLYCVGGRPLFFLDYYATGVLDDAQFKSVLTGIKRGLAPCGAALMGGETAELPGLYEKGHFDLAGFVVGVVDGKQMLGEGRVQAGDILFALPSSGFHSNGYSLVRHWLKQKPVDTATMQKILAPTRVYHEIPELLSKVGPSVFHALANITGGGISGNLPRVMPAGAVCKIRSQDIPTPPWMKQFIEGNGSTVMANEAVFNLGAGMIASVAAAQSDAFAAAARAMKLDVVPIGTVDLTGGRDEARVVFQ